MALALALWPALVGAAAPRPVALPDKLELGPFAATAAHLYFVGARAGETARLWQTDGTPATTHPVWTDEGDELAAPRHLATSPSWMYFAATGLGSGADTLYRTDGNVVQALAQVPVERGFAGQSRLFFTVAADQVEHLWQTDGSTTTDTGITLPRSAPALAYRDTLLFAGAGANGVEPWQTDGTKDGSRELADLVPGEGGSYPDVFAVVGESATFFSFAAPTALWRTEAGVTRSVTTFVSDSAPEPQVVGAYGFDRRVYFRARDTDGSWAVWASDGTAPGTVALARLAPGQLEAPMHGAVSTLFFAAEHAGMPALYATGGSRENTRVIAAGTVSALTARGEYVYFTLDTTHLGGTDGTPAGTALRELPHELGALPGPGGVFETVGDTLFFSTRMPDLTARLWALDLPAPTPTTITEPAAPPPEAPEAEAANKADEGCDCSPQSVFSPFSGLFAFAFLRRPSGRSPGSRSARGLRL